MRIASIPPQESPTMTAALDRELVEGLDQRARVVLERERRRHLALAVPRAVDDDDAPERSQRRATCPRHMPPSQSRLWQEDDGRVAPLPCASPTSS